MRRWSTAVPVEFMSETARSGARSDRDHVVPVLVIVDRLISKPRSVKRILATTVVIAKVTPEEHRALGPIRRGHPDLYAQMMTCRQDELVDLGWERYKRSNVEVADVDGRTPWSR